MRRDKTLLELGGEPLVRHAVRKLRRLGLDASILSDRSELAEFAPLVPDLHPGCGPVGGMEAALAHTRGDWALVLPVDMPFLPVVLLEQWMKRIADSPMARASLFTIDGVPQPALCLLHRELAPLLRSAAEEGRFKLYPVLHGAASELALKQRISLDAVFLSFELGERTGIGLSQGHGGESWDLSAVSDVRHLWFVNLNTPAEFAEAERHADALRYLNSLDRTLFEGEMGQ
jgi:molybdopterin-guanine dinucleotide biosynthesis protein A